MITSLTIEGFKSFGNPAALVDVPRQDWRIVNSRGRRLAGLILSKPGGTRAPSTGFGSASATVSRSAPNV
jgi:hypothetical protein